ncbi:MAG: hypothetical protein ACYSTY_11520 [Planctomycetota bacterium]
MSRETPHMQIIMVRRVSSSVAGLAALAAGCAGPLNDQIGLSAAEPLPALSAEPAREAPSAEPSLHGLDRSHWPTIKVTVPGGQVEHWPAYTRNIYLSDTTARQRGEFPTVDSALEGGASVLDQGLESDLNLLVALLQIPWFPVEVIGGRWPGQLEHSPSEPYARASPERQEDLYRWIDAPADGPEK